MGTPLTEDQVRTLLGAINGDRVAERTQSGRSLSFVEAWDIRATLIRVFGFAGFDIETLSAEIIKEETDVPNARGDKVNPYRLTALARVRLTIHQTGATYVEAAAASQTGPDYGEVADFAIKTAESDAMKRAAVNLGTQFGLSLYARTHSDVVRVLFAPDQKYVTDALRGERQEAHNQVAGGLKGNQEPAE